MGSKNLYQHIYENFSWYGDAHQDRCPGVRLIPHYRDWIVSPVLDLGCGRGHTVEKLRQMGFRADGIDQVTIHPDMITGDICQPIENIAEYASVICMDCIEHLYDDEVGRLFENMAQVGHQAFSIHNGSSAGTGTELHINLKPFETWESDICRFFEIIECIKINKQQNLYLTQSI